MAQEQGFFDFIGQANKVWHDRARRNREDLFLAFGIACFQANAAQAHSFQFRRTTAIMQNITSADILWKQFWMFGNHLIKPFAIGLAIIHNFVVVLCFDGERYSLLRSCYFYLCFGRLSLRHVGYSLGRVLAQSCLIFA
jgi:hypothetical protein